MPSTTANFLKISRLNSIRKELMILQGRKKYRTRSVKIPLASSFKIPVLFKIAPAATRKNIMTCRVHKLLMSIVSLPSSVNLINMAGQQVTGHAQKPESSGFCIYFNSSACLHGSCGRFCLQHLRKAPPRAPEPLRYP